MAGQTDEGFALYKVTQDDSKFFRIEEENMLTFAAQVDLDFLANCAQLPWRWHIPSNTG